MTTLTRTRRFGPLLLAVFLTACGSTVADRATPTADTLSTTGGPALSPAAPPESPGSTGAAGRPGGLTGGFVPDAGAAASRPPITLPRSAGVARGPIEVGIVVDRSGASGIPGDSTGALNTGNNENQVRAIIAEINRTGGSGGRPLVPVLAPFSFDPNSEDAQVQEQSACDRWTKDHDVFVGMTPLINAETVLTPCMAKSRTPLLLENLGAYPAAFYGRYSDWLFSPAMASLDRSVPAYVSGLISSGFLTPSNRIGLLRVDLPKFEEAARQIVRPMLRRHGLQLVDEQAMTDETQMNSAVLHMRQERVDRVIFLTEGGGTLMFVTAAHAQQADWRYGFSSYDVPAIIATILPTEAIAGSEGIGWIPLVDVSVAPTNAAGQRCLKLMLAAGEEMKSAPSRGVAFSYCDLLFLLDRILDRNPGLTRDQVRAAVESVGTSMEPALTFGTRLDAAHHDGTRYARRFVHGPCGSSSCFAYRGGLISLS